MTTPSDLVTLGHIAVLLQQPYSRVVRLIDALGLLPVFTVNGTPHYDETIIAKLRPYLDAEAVVVKNREEYLAKRAKVRGCKVRVVPE